mmetsp:Transcript_137985/g.440723  ORF Transcript_137985/g.440723 Transcript_137985/m.440723 type:complete len:287 (+) Transcript_137985:34-894(+)
MHTDVRPAKTAHRHPKVQSMLADNHRGLHVRPGQASPMETTSQRAINPSRHSQGHAAGLVWMVPADASEPCSKKAYSSSAAQSARLLKMRCSHLCNMAIASSSRSETKSPTDSEADQRADTCGEAVLAEVGAGRIVPDRVVEFVELGEGDKEVVEDACGRARRGADAENRRADVGLVVARTRDTCDPDPEGRLIQDIGWVEPAADQDVILVEELVDTHHALVSGRSEATLRAAVATVGAVASGLLHAMVQVIGAHADDRTTGEPGVHLHPRTALAVRARIAVHALA